MPQYLNGLYLALLEGRFLFDFVHEQQLTPPALARYAAVLLPNVAWLSDAQCEALPRLRRGRRLAPRHVPDQPVRRSGQPRAPTSGSLDVFGSARRARSSAPPATPTWGASKAATRSSTASARRR
jgi:hypothetical protein